MKKIKFGWLTNFSVMTSVLLLELQFRGSTLNEQDGWRLSVLMAVFCVQQTMAYVGHSSNILPNICCQAPLVFLITHDNIMVKWGQLVWPKTVWTKGEWWISSRVLIFAFTTYGSTQQSKQSKAPFSHFYGACPVTPNGYMSHEEVELLSWAQAADFVVFTFSLLLIKKTCSHIFIKWPVNHWISSIFITQQFKIIGIS